MPGFAQTFLLDGKPPDAGATLKQPALAATLDHLVHAGLDDFYRGDVGREIAADLERIGSPVTRADLAGYEASVRDPLSVALQAGTLYNTPPPTQGLASLIVLTGYSSPALHIAATLNGAAAVLSKPQSVTCLGDLIHSFPRRDSNERSL